MTLDQAGSLFSGELTFRQDNGAPFLILPWATPYLLHAKVKAFQAPSPQPDC